MVDTIKLEHCLQQKSSQKGVLQFLHKIRKFKMAIIFGKNFVKKQADYSKKISSGSKIWLKPMSHGFQAILCFAFFAKNSKNEYGRHFWRDKNFFKTGLTTLQRYPMAQKFLSRTVLEILEHFCVLQFLQKIQNGHHFWQDNFSTRGECL